VSVLFENENGKDKCYMGWEWELIVAKKSVISYRLFLKLVRHSVQFADLLHMIRAAVWIVN